MKRRKKNLNMGSILLSTNRMASLPSRTASRLYYQPVTVLHGRSCESSKERKMMSASSTTYIDVV